MVGALEHVDLFVSKAAEEVLRMYGYDKLPSTLISGRMTAGARNERQRLVARAQAAMVGQGFYEAMSYSFIGPQMLAKLGLANDDPRMNPIVIRNPLGEDTSVMRTTLVPSMLQSLSLNLSRGTHALRLFEIAPCFFRRLLKLGKRSGKHLFFKSPFRKSVVPSDLR